MRQARIFASASEELLVVVFVCCDVAAPLGSGTVELFVVVDELLVELLAPEVVLGSINRHSISCISSSLTL